MTTSLDQRGVFTDRSITIDVEKVQQTTYITENIGRQLVDDNCGIAMLMSNLESLITHALQVPNSICLDRPSIRKAVAAQHAKFPRIPGHQISSFPSRQHCLSLA